MPVINVRPKAVTTPGLNLPNTVSPNGDIYEATMLLDVLLHGAPKSITTTTPPTGPNLGDTYIIPTGATGAWAGQIGNIAVCNPATIRDGKPDLYRWTWDFIPAKTGMVFFVQDITAFYLFNGTAWVTAPLVYVGTAPANSSAAGVKGQIAMDGSGNLYFCYATNTWRKVTGASF